MPTAKRYSGGRLLLNALPLGRACCCTGSITQKPHKKKEFVCFRFSRQDDTLHRDLRIASERLLHVHSSRRYFDTYFFYFWFYLLRFSAWLACTACDDTILRLSCLGLYMSWSIRSLGVSFLLLVRDVVPTARHNLFYFILFHHHQYCVLRSDVVIS